MLFILYLAVNNKIRSHGYGSQILQSVKNHVYTKPIVLNVEAANPNAANSQQREKRIEFYRKNGITDTNYVFIDSGETYSVLSSDSVNFQVHEYEKLLSRFHSEYIENIFFYANFLHIGQCKDRQAAFSGRFVGADMDERVFSSNHISVVFSCFVIPVFMRSDFLLEFHPRSAVEAFCSGSTQDILKIQSRPRLEPGPDYHYLVQVTKFVSTYISLKAL